MRFANSIPMIQSNCILPDPITPLTPMSSCAKNTPMITVASSGADEPAAMNLCDRVKRR